MATTPRARSSAVSSSSRLSPPLLEGSDELEVLELHDDRAPEHPATASGWVLGVRSIALAMRSAAAVTSS